MRKKPLIVVEWEDTSGSIVWVKEETVKATEPVHCTTVGWEIELTSKKLVICATKSEEGDYSDRSTIPRGCIKSIRTLE